MTCSARATQVAVGLLAVLAAPLAGAHLRVVDNVTDRLTAGTGARVEVVAPEVGMRAPEDSSFSVGASSNMTLTDGSQPACSVGTASILLDLEVEPDEGEYSGDCVRITFCHSGEFSVSRSASNMGAVAGEGGAGATPSCSAGPPPLGQISFSGPGRLIFDPSGVAEVLSSFGPQVIAAESPDQSFENCGELSVRIGDQLRVEIAAGAGTFGTPVGTAESSAVQRVSIQTRACPVQEIPTISARGAALMALALGVLALLGLRRRAARPAR